MIKPEIATCPNNHIYNKAVYETCPYCQKIEARQSRLENQIVRDSSGGLNRGGIDPENATELDSGFGGGATELEPEYGGDATELEPEYGGDATELEPEYVGGATELDPGDGEGATELDRGYDGGAAEPEWKPYGGMLQPEGETPANEAADPGRAEIVFCVNHHLYDRSMHRTCPYCGSPVLEEEHREERSEAEGRQSVTPEPGSRFMTPEPESRFMTPEPESRFVSLEPRTNYVVGWLVACGEEMTDRGECLILRQQDHRLIGRENGELVLISAEEIPVPGADWMFEVLCDESTGRFSVRNLGEQAFAVGGTVCGPASTADLGANAEITYQGARYRFCPLVGADGFRWR